MPRGSAFRLCLRPHSIAFRRIRRGCRSFRTLALRSSYRAYSAVAHRHPPVQTNGSPPEGDHVKPLFLAAPGQFRPTEWLPCGALADRALVYRSFALRLVPHQSAFPDWRYAPNSDRLPHLLRRTSRCRRNATVLLLSRHHRYSLMHEGTCTCGQIHAPCVCMRAFGLRSSYSHTCPCRPHRPLADRRPRYQARFHCPFFLPTLRSAFSNGQVTALNGFTELPPDLA